MKVRWMGVVGVLLLSLLVVLPAVAAPGGPGSELRPQGEGSRVHRGGRAAGTVVSVGADSLQITHERGERTIYVEGSTRFVIPEVESPGLEDVEVGNFVLAQGKPTEDGLRARVLVVRPAKPARLRGEVESIGSEGLALLTEEGTVAVSVDEITHFRLPDLEEPTLEDLEVGTTVVVVGQAVDEGVLARLVTVPRPRQGKLRGTVTARGTNSLTVERREGQELTLTVTDETDFVVPEVAEPTLADIEVGAVVGIRARMEGDTAFALHVAVIPSGAAALVGEVLGIEGSMIRVQTRLDQVIEVQTDATTKFYVPGEEGGDLEALQTGDRIQCSGEWEADGTFRAWAVRVPSRRDRVEVGGLILSMEGEGFRLGTRYGIVSVRVTDETRYRSREEPDFGFEDLEQGRRVHVHGLREEEGLLAQEIFSR